MAAKRIRQSNAELLEILFMTYRTKMYAIAFSILHNEEQAEDAVGDAFEKLLPYLEKCRDVESDRTKRILTRFVKNTAIDIYRKNKRDWKNISLEEKEYLMDSHDAIEEYTKCREEQETLTILKNMLPDCYWEVLYLRYYENISVDEIARRLCLSKANVYSRIRRSKSKAQKILEKKNINEMFAIKSQ